MDLIVTDSEIVVPLAKKVEIALPLILFITILIYGIIYLIMQNPEIQFQLKQLLEEINRLSKTVKKLINANQK